MNPKYEPLFTPWKIGNVEIKNRIVMCPMGGTSLFGWLGPVHLSEEAQNFFLDKAKNNVGLIIPGIAPIRNPMGNKWLYEDKKVWPLLKEYMAKIHETGAKLFVQLTAGFGRSFAIPSLMLPLLKHKFLGKIASFYMDAERMIASPSELPARWYPEITTRALTAEEIKEMVMGFAKTAKLLKDADVDGVEVHAVHEGYLLDQFTLKCMNQRTDEYGGSFENRYRFPVEIVQAIKKVCGDDYPVSVRYSIVSKTKAFDNGALPEEKDYVEIGRDMEESERAIKYLEGAGYDMFDCDNGTYDAWYWAHPPMYMPENCNLDDCAHIRKFTTKPVVAAGRLTPEASAKAILEGKIDGMGVARQFLADPHWVTKLIEDKEDDIMPCISCHNACLVFSRWKGVPNMGGMHNATYMARCAINPESMNSKIFYIEPAETKKKVAIVGGGIGGMEAARVLKLRGHDVTIYEKTDKLGGVFIAAAAPSFKGHDKKLIEWWKKQIRDLGIEVKYNTTITDIDSLKVDEVIVATGASPKKIPGLEGVEAIEYLLGEKEVGDRVLVVGGGLTGSEIAYDLHLKGKTPIIVESREDLICAPGVSLANSSFLRDYFKYHEVETHLESLLCRMEGKEAVIKSVKDGSEKKVPVDSVIVSIGYNPNPLVEKGRHVHLVGDCLKVGNLKDVVWRAYKVAMSI